MLCSDQDAHEAVVKTGVLESKRPGLGPSAVASLSIQDTHCVPGTVWTVCEEHPVSAPRCWDLRGETVINICVCSVIQSCLTPCDPMEYSPPASSVYGIFQARTLEWVAISSSRGSSWPRDRTRVSCIGRRILHPRATGEVIINKPKL